MPLIARGMAFQLLEVFLCPRRLVGTFAWTYRDVSLAGHLCVVREGSTCLEDRYCMTELCL